MTPCADVRELLLEAEPDELSGNGTTTVAEHVRACPHCARLAGRILEETERLHGFLEARPTPPVEDILRRAGVEARRAARRRWIWAPTLAAAAVTALFVVLETGGPDPSTGPAFAATTSPPLVEPTSDRTVAVLPTDDPDITVLWFF